MSGVYAKHFKHGDNNVPKARKAIKVSYDNFTGDAATVFFGIQKCLGMSAKDSRLLMDANERNSIAVLELVTEWHTAKDLPLYFPHKTKLAILKMLCMNNSRNELKKMATMMNLEPWIKNMHVSPSNKKKLNSASFSLLEVATRTNPLILIHIGISVDICTSMGDFLNIELSQDQKAYAIALSALHRAKNEGRTFMTWDLMSTYILGAGFHTGTMKKLMTIHPYGQELNTHALHEHFEDDEEAFNMSIAEMSRLNDKMGLGDAHVYRNLNNNIMVVEDKYGKNFYLKELYFAEKGLPQLLMTLIMRGKKMSKQ
jgi:hypothetical protein